MSRTYRIKKFDEAKKLYQPRFLGPVRKVSFKQQGFDSLVALEEIQEEGFTVRNREKVRANQLKNTAKDNFPCRAWDQFSKAGPYKNWFVDNEIK